MYNGNEPPLWKEHIRFMQKALAQAEIAYGEGEVPVGAVIVHGDVIVGRGYNQTERLGDPTAHAEMIAISAACDTLGEKFLNECTLYVTLEPCAMCAGAIVWSRVGRVVFGAIDEKAGACGTRFQIAASRKLNHRAELVQGVLESECADILGKFFRNRR